MSQRIIRRSDGSGAGVLYVPTRIVRTVPDDARFEVELTDEGVLYRFVGCGDEPQDDLPAWTNGGEK